MALVMVRHMHIGTYICRNTYVQVSCLSWTLPARESLIVQTVEQIYRHTYIHTRMRIGTRRMHMQNINTYIQ